jgi:hypothetical protein
VSAGVQRLKVRQKPLNVAPDRRTSISASQTFAPAKKVIRIGVRRVDLRIFAPERQLPRNSRFAGALGAIERAAIDGFAQATAAENSASARSKLSTAPQMTSPTELTPDYRPLRGLASTFGP